MHRNEFPPMSETETGSTGLKLAREHWDEAAAAREAGGHRGWLDSALVLEEIFQPRVSGDRRKNWLIALCERLGVPAGQRWLSLGCGTAGHELLLARLGLCGSLEAVDLSPVSLEIARAAASAEGLTNITFRQDDLNRIELPADSFDVVLMNMSLHHVARLERLLDQIEAALRPGGWLLLNEYVGPRQFQFPDSQLRLVARLLAALPERLRVDSTTGAVKTEYVRRPPSWWDQADPSEAICSDRILRQIERRFEIVDRRDYGGALLHLLLEHVVQNFDAGRAEDVVWIQALGEIEAVLQESGVVASDFVVIGARTRPGGAGPGESLARKIARRLGLSRESCGVPVENLMAPGGRKR